MKIPTVSVALVACNVERFLAEAIESILNQTFRDFEFIIVDFGSTDDSPSIIKRYQEKDGRVQFHVIPHCNLSEARNACCFRARGKYLALLDADDEALPGRLARQVEFLENHPEIAILGGAVELIDETGRRFGTSGTRENDKELRRTLEMYSPFVVSSVTLRAEEFRAVGGYRKAFARAEGSNVISYGEDYDLWLRMMEHCKAATVGEVVARYRIHSGQMWGRNLKQVTTGCSVARASARIRSQGTADPLNSVDTITPDLLAQLGIPREQLESDVLKTYATCVINALRANVGAAALRLVEEMLEALAEARAVPAPVVAETWLTAARAYWRQGDLARACGATARAFRARPLFVTEIPWRGIRRVVRRGIQSSPELFASWQVKKNG